MWFIHQDRETNDPDLDSFSITTSNERGGWNTDSGYNGYGLPQELAQWICDILNQHGKDCPFTQDTYGYWIKK